MKLVVVFEVPDEQAETYATVVSDMIMRHRFADQQAIKHWSFDLEMRPVAGAVATTLEEVAEALKSTQTCGRCGQPASTIHQIGPYRVCDTCEPIVAGR